MTETTTDPKPEPNPKAEIAAMQAVSAAIVGLDEPAVERVLRWVAEAHGIKSVRTEKRSEPHTEGNDAVPRFESLAELHDAASPETDADRALVGGYWFQFVEGQPDFGAQEVNTALKNLGRPIANITGAFNNLKNRKPAPVVQLKKAGTTKQARKTYKLTVEGKRAVELMIGQH